jgi:hypothetical protein
MICLNDDDLHPWQRGPVAGLRLVTVDLLESLHSLDAGHLVAGLIANLGQCVNVSSSFAGSQHVQLGEIGCLNGRLPEGFVQAMLGNACLFGCLVSREAIPDHCLDCDPDFAGYALQFGV